MSESNCVLSYMAPDFTEAIETANISIAEASTEKHVATFQGTLEAW